MSTDSCNDNDAAELLVNVALPRLNVAGRQVNRNQRLLVKGNGNAICLDFYSAKIRRISDRTKGIHEKLGGGSRAYTPDGRKGVATCKD